MTRGSTELFDCARVSDYLESYLSGQVPPPERRGMRLHIHGCSACHRMVTERDPLQFFAPLADQERAQTDPAAWDGFYDAIRDGIALDTGRRQATRRRAWLSAAAAAVILLIGAGLAASYLLVNRDKPAIVQTEPSAPSAMQASLIPGPMPQTVERVTGTGVGEVQIYTMNYYQDDAAAGSVAQGTGQTAELVLIVDAGIEL